MIVRARAIENSAFVLLGRVLRASDGEPIEQADVATIVLKTFHDKALGDIAKGTLVVPAGEDAETYTGTALDPADVLYDTLQTGDPRWDVDEEGFNFAVVLDGSFLPTNNTFQVEVIVTPIAGPAMTGLWVIQTLNTYHNG